MNRASGHRLDVLLCAGTLAVALPGLLQLGTSPIGRLLWIAELAEAIVVVLLLIVRPPPRTINAKLSTCGLVIVSLTYSMFLDFEQLEAVERAPLVLGVVVQVFVRVSVLGCVLRLWTSFSVLPQLRSIRVTWPYSWVRHPLYSLYIAEDLVLLTWIPSLRTLAVLFVGWSSLVLRARLEEATLRRSKTYRNYARRTKWRFIPLVY